jgi:3-oxoacyl-[acyl-carrier-protein] synthase-3
LFHQGSRVILEELTQKLNLEPSKVISNIEQLGNTASASLPILLGELTNKLVSKDKLILSGFGVGLSWGTILIEVN